MRRAAIVAPVRSAVGVYGGSLRPVPVEKLIASVIKALIERSGLDAAKLDDVIIAQSYANGEAPCIGRYAVLEADLPIEIPGYQLDRRCGGGLQAVLNAAMMVQTGAADAVLAGGVESMSNIEYYSTDMRWGKRAGSVTLHDRMQGGRERSQPEWRFGRISAWNDRDRLNVNGSGVSLGHPIAATGVRILATLLNELKRRKGRYALETMCVGSGQGVAAIFERA